MQSRQSNDTSAPPSGEEASLSDPSIPTEDSAASVWQTFPHSHSQSTRSLSEPPTRSKPHLSSDSSNANRKYNVVIYGVNENPERTSRHLRLSKDVESVTSTLQSLDLKDTEHCIRDCIRLGKYDSTRHRPLLVKLASTCMVSTILANRAKLASTPGITIRPDLTKQERATESLLLKEQRLFINAGTEKKKIKIRGNTLFVNNTKFGSVTNSEFLRTISSLSILEPSSSLLDEHPNSRGQVNHQSASVTSITEDDPILLGTGSQTRSS